MMESKDVPYIVYEGAMVRAERIIKRLVIVIVLEILLIVATNAGWLWYINQYDFETYSYEQDGTGLNVIGDRNGFNYGTEISSQTKDASQEEDR